MLLVYASTKDAPDMDSDCGTSGASITDVEDEERIDSKEAESAVDVCSHALFASSAWCENFSSLLWMLPSEKTEEE